MPEPVKRNVAGGVALLILGLVILIPSGLCTGIMAGGAIWSMFTHPGMGALPLSGISGVLAFGGPFIAGGAVLVWQGIKRMRGRK
jgi:hypothetical protein